MHSTITLYLHSLVLHFASLSYYSSYFFIFVFRFGSSLLSFGSPFCLLYYRSMALLLPSTLTSLHSLFAFSTSLSHCYSQWFSSFVLDPWTIVLVAAFGLCFFNPAFWFAFFWLFNLVPWALVAVFVFWIWKLSLWVLVISVFVFDSLILVLHPDSWSLSLGYLGWDLSLGFLVFGFTLGPWNLIPGSWSLILGFQLLFIYLRSLAPDFDSRSCYWPTWVF